MTGYVATLGLEIDSKAAALASRELDRLVASGRKAEDAFKRIERAAALGGTRTDGYAASLRKAYGIQEQMTKGQINVIRQYETLIAKTDLLSKGMNREAAQLVALRRAGTTANTSYGQTVAMLAGHLYDLEQQQERTNRSAGSLANTLTRRFVLGYLTTQIRQVATSLLNLNKSLADVGDIAGRTGTSAAQLQGLQAVAGGRGIAAADFNTAIVKFNEGIDDAKRGAGELNALFRMNGATVGSLEESLAKVADLVRNAGNETAKTRILQDAGLPATREWVKLMEQGGAVLRGEIASALSDGVATSDQLVQNAKRFNEEWDRGLTRLSMQSRSAFAEIMGWLNKISDRATGALANLVPSVPTNMLRDAMTGGSIQGSRLTQGDANSFYDRIGFASEEQRRSKSLADRRSELSLEAQRIALLGQSASVAEQVRVAEIQIELARLNNINLTKEQAASIRQLAWEQALGIDRIRAATDAHRIEAQVLGMTTAQAEAYRVVQERINEAKRRGEQLGKADIERIKREAEEMGKAAEHAQNMREAHGNLRSSFVEFGRSLREGASAWEAFRQAGENALGRIADKLMEMAADQLWRAAFPTGGGGAGLLGLFGLGGNNNLAGASSTYMMGGYTVPVFHKGGIVGQSGGERRYIHPAYFDGAPRYHSGGMAGLRPDEVPAILQRGEMVIPKSGIRGPNSGGISVNMPISVQGGGEADTMNAVRKGIVDYARSPAFEADWLRQQKKARDGRRS